MAFRAGPQLKTSAEIARLREANLIVAEVLDEVGRRVAPGVSTWELEESAREVLKRRGATSAFMGYQPGGGVPPFPAVLCTSRNEVIVHGIPSKMEVLEDGDILSVDFGCFKDGWCGDSARTFPVGEVSDEARMLLKVTRESLELAIAQMQPTKRLGDVSFAVQKHCEAAGFAVVRKFVGHGIGRAMHESPQVPNYGRPGRGPRLHPGLVLAIEPMVNVGTSDVDILDDGWTAVTKDRSLSAHFEHSVAVTQNGPMVLSMA
ncbi:MAG: type I methionyl aminopeptidase [Polyangia bacterium]|jgi:methionyl aminopeptidase|nr:type I methionyl aminopeptidase [Polyangia bacterium]